LTKICNFFECFSFYFLSTNQTRNILILKILKMRFKNKNFTNSKVSHQEPKAEQGNLKTWKIAKILICVHRKLVENIKKYQIYSYFWQTYEKHTISIFPNFWVIWSWKIWKIFKKSTFFQHTSFFSGNFWTIFSTKCSLTSVIC